VLEAVPAQSLVGDRVTEVEARAKHLLIRFGSGRVLHTHMRMTGAWHVYRAGERWKRPAWQARLVLEAGERIAVLFNAPVIELLVIGGEALHPALSGLGPDVLAPELDLDEVWRRAAQLEPATEMGDLLLNQRVVSGIGNIYRCETLFVHKTHPRAALGSIPEETLRAMMRTAAELMIPNAMPSASVGRDFGLGPDRRWVYGRSGRPCRRCGTVIASGRVGTQARTAYWCPRCQPAP
jgi:endonuclease-8